MINVNELRDQEMEPLRQALSKMSDGEDHEDEVVESPQVNRSQSAASGANQEGERGKYFGNYSKCDKTKNQ